ncbi:septal ring lytic transglycosylase RlpA family protein [Sphingomonas solaris]|uniref:septal ring lytic transglycosylase RlpA family protein n=1 Tax=Alterirhizorhabdus solaris TaxID=2529389 RepID=UPI001396AB9F|nr:septal ring lytic transglycosylase RlpA family protein [Sphingomonas solaris]
MPSRNNAAGWLALAGTALLAACATDRPQRGGRTVSDTPVKIGAPYRAGGRMWVPTDDRDYDAVGYASWYGGAHAGRPTANGERFDPRGISAAHPTLPLPSYVEVTALDSGRTILTRVNDRGPFVASRIIDLSAGAARALGIERQGVARVRVRRVQPPEVDRVALRAGRAARARPDAGREMLASLAVRTASGPAHVRPSPAAATRRGLAASSGGPASRPGGAARVASTAALSGVGVASGVIASPLASAAPAIPASIGAASGAAALRGALNGPAASGPLASGTDAVGYSNGASSVDVAVPLATGTRPSPTRPGPASPAMRLYVQVAALDDADRADGLAGSLAAIGPAAATAAGSRWQVRLGPYADAASARSALARAQRAGYQEARIVRDSAQ